MNRFKKSAIFGSTIIVLGLVLSACSLYGTQSNTGQTNQAQQQDQTSLAQSSVTVTFSDSGVDFATVTVKSGGTVTWTNSGSNTIAVASNPHPTHTDNQELTNGQSTLQLTPGASATVTLSKKGTWGYHNHLDLSVGGKVVVE